MKKRITNLVLTGIFSLSITACGTEPQSTFQVVGYDQSAQPVQQAAQQTVSAPVKKATTTTKKATTTTNKKTTTASTSKTTTEVKPATTKTSTATSSLSVAQKLLAKSKQTYDGLTSFSATITMFSKRNEKTNPNSKPLTTGETKYIFQAPRTSFFSVVKHSNSMIIDAKMVWKGGNSARVKASGVLGLLPMEMNLDDDKMTTNRDWRFDQMDHVGILARALKPEADVSLAGKANINGKDAYMIKVKGVGLDDLITEESIAIDVKNYLIIADEMYAGKDLVFQTKINVEGTNVQIPAGTFDI